MSRKANLSAAKRRAADAPPSLASLRRGIMAGHFKAKPKAAEPKAPALPAALPAGAPDLPQLAAAAEAERARVLALTGLQAQAERMGLAGFDLSAAIASGQPVQRVRAAVLDQAATRDAQVGEIAAIAFQDANGRSGHGGISAAAKRAAYRRGLTGKP